MNKLYLIIGLCLAIGGYAFLPGRPVLTPEQAVATNLLRQIDSFTVCVHGFLDDVYHGRSESVLQEDFLRVRLAYKRFEWAAEYFNPVLARQLNGPPVPEAEPEMDADPSPGTPADPARYRVLEPEGLQVIETQVFPHYDRTNKKQLSDYLHRLEADAGVYKLRFSNIDIFGWQVFDAAKLEVFRVVALGIAGFDAPLSKNSLPEAAAALEGVRCAVKYYEPGDPYPLDRQFGAATGYLHAGAGYQPAAAGFDTFDRAVFITRFANPLSRGITQLATDLRLPMIRYHRLLRQDAATLFDSAAFDVDAYAPGPEYATTEKKIALGARLFSDPQLSGDQHRSCASCHRPDRAFADGLMRNTAIGGGGLLQRNTPSLLNVALQPGFFYDVRVRTLEAQVSDVLRSPMEMQSSAQNAALRLGQDTLYRRLFGDAFGHSPAGIDTLELENALAAYVRSLVRLNSAFDAYMRGDSAVLTPEAIRGFNLFMGKARCGTCHYLPLFNGVFPPMFNRLETEVIGVPGKDLRSLDADPGRFGVLPAPFLLHAFKTPTIRNAACTAPYMHNGVFARLEDVVDFYDHGGGAGSGWKVDDQTLAADSLCLSGKEKEALIAFMKSLDSR